MSLASCTTVWHSSEWLRSEVLFIAVFCLASQLLSRPESASSLTLGQFVFRTKQPSFRWCFNNVCNSTQYYICCSHLSSSTRRFWDTKGQCSCRRPRSLDRLQRLMQAVREERKGVKTLPMSPLLAFPLRVVLLSKNKLLFKTCGSTESRADLSWTYSPTGRMVTCNSTGSWYCCCGANRNKLTGKRLARRRGQALLTFLDNISEFCRLSDRDRRSRYF